jgi:hypothetical protein
MNSKRKCKSDNESNISCEVTDITRKIRNILKMRGRMSAATFDVTFRRYFILTFNAPMIIYYIIYFVYK